MVVLVSTETDIIHHMADTANFPVQLRSNDNPIVRRDRRSRGAGRCDQGRFGSGIASCL